MPRRSRNGRVLGARFFLGKRTHTQTVCALSFVPGRGSVSALSTCQRVKRNRPLKVKQGPRVHDGYVGLGWFWREKVLACFEQTMVDLTGIEFFLSSFRILARCFWSCWYGSMVRLYVRSGWFSHLPYCDCDPISVSVRTWLLF